MLRLFVVPILDNPCYAQEPKQHKLLWWTWNTYPHHDLNLSYLKWEDLWWEISIRCKHCEASHIQFGLDDAEIVDMFRLKRIPEQDRHMFYHEEDLEKLR